MASTSRPCSVAAIVLTVLIRMSTKAIGFPQITTRFIETPLVAVHTPMRRLRPMSVRLAAGVGTGRKVAAQVRKAVTAEVVDTWLRQRLLAARSARTHHRFSCTSGSDELSLSCISPAPESNSSQPRAYPPITRYKGTLRSSSES